MDAFWRCGGPVMSAELLLSEATLQEVLKLAEVHGSPLYTRISLAGIIAEVNITAI